MLTALFEDDPTLEPRDVLVLCPDVEQFAPLVRAAFGSTVSTPAGTARHPGHDLRVQLADRQLAATNPLVELAEIVVGLVAGRVTASEVLGLAAHEAVARRFRFDEDDLATLGHWVAESGARWGLDAAHRGEYGLRDLADNTWANALDRLALGVAVAADSDADAAANAPIDDIGSNDIARVGRFLELLDLVRAAAEHVRQPSVNGGTPGRLTAGEWTDWLRETVTSLGEVAREDRWQHAQFLSELATIAAGGEGLPLRINDIVVLLGQRWGARPSRANFRTGAMTVCTMVPMRTIPHRVVAILGLDDGAFPRSPVVDGDDVLARRPLVGQRDPRSEDRQLLLDALMSASDHFVALYSGHDEHTGARRPPAVPLQELISAANRTGQAPATSADANGVVRLHPLQAFDARNFGPQTPIPGGSFDRAALDGAVALSAHRRSGDTTRPLMVTEPLPVQPVSAVTLEELTRFYENPAREFCRQRLGIAAPREDDEPTDHIPIGLDGLETWQIGDRVLRAVLDGGDTTTALEREQRAGTLPPVALGGRLRQEIAGTVAAIARGVDTGARRSVEVRIDLPSGVRVHRCRERRRGPPAHPDDLLDHLRQARNRRLGAPARARRRRAGQPRGLPSSPARRARRGSPLLPPTTPSACSTGSWTFAPRGMRYPLGLPPKTARAFAVQAVRGDLPAIQQSAFSGRRLRVGRPLPRTRRPLVGPPPRAAGPARASDHLGTLSYWAPRVWGPLLQARGRS